MYAQFPVRGFEDEEAPGEASPGASWIVEIGYIRRSNDASSRNLAARLCAGCGGLASPARFYSPLAALPPPAEFVISKIWSVSLKGLAFSIRRSQSRRRARSADISSCRRMTAMA